MKNFTRKIILSALLTVILPVLAFAQATTSGIQISPLTYNFDIKPGESKEATITVTNQGSEVLNYVCEVENFSQVSNDGAPSFQAVKTQEGVTELADWITFKDTKEGTIPAEQEKTITFTVSVPQGAEPGGHYAAVFAKEVKKNPEGKTEIGVASRVGTLVLVSVPGKASKAAELLSFIYKKFVWKGPIDFTLNIKNSDSVHFDSPAKVELKPLFGSSKSVDMGSHTIIPNNTREYKANWDNKYPFGYYKIQATAQDGDGIQMMKEGSIIAIPLMIVIPALVLLLVIMLIIRYVKKNFKITAKQENKKD